VKLPGEQLTVSRSARQPKRTHLSKWAVVTYVVVNVGYRILAAMRRSANRRANHRPSGQTHFYQAQTSSTAEALLHRTGCGTNMIVKYRRQRMIAIGKFISRGETSLGV
jgi:hypothetical protein